MSAELLFQNAEASLSAYFLAKIAGAETDLVDLAKTAAQHQLEAAAAKAGGGALSHLVNAATVLLSIGDKAGAAHVLQRAAAAAPAHFKHHVKGALDGIHKAPKPAAPAAAPPKPVDAKPAEAPKPAPAPKAEAPKVEAPKPAAAEAPKPTEPAKPAEGEKKL